MAWPRQVRSFISLLIVLHFSIVFIVLSANNNYSVASNLQRTLNDFLGIYSQSLNLDPMGVNYSLTLATDADDDHFIEVYLEGESEVLRYPPLNASTLSADVKRQRRWAAVLSSFADDDDATTCAEIVKGIGSRAMSRAGKLRGSIRCWRHTSKFIDADPNEDEWTPGFFTMTYEADFWSYGDQTEVLKRPPAREAAPVTD